MSEKTPLTKRAAKLAVLTVGGGVALTFAMAGSASADDVTVQDANVTNAGAAAANSGGNVSIGNASTNVAANGQGSAGLIASNNGTATNQSNGTSSITTGQATATGSVAGTSVDQASEGDGGPGLDVVVQDADVTNAGIAAANSGGNVGVGNASTNIAVNGQGALGGAAVNNGGASNQSNGTSSITTGAATATGNKSVTDVDQDAGHAGGPGLGLGVVVQTTDVLNLGAAAANSGGNLGIGNASGNLALNLQGAGGLFASNNGSAGNKSDGKSTIKTGAASATGNQSLTSIDQAADPADGPGLSLVFQDADVLNLGVAAANSGGNVGIGNISGNLAINAQGALGLVATNNGGASNDSKGTVDIATGAATATGNQSGTTVKQGADPDPGGLALVFQQAPVINAGIGVANSGLNVDVANASFNAAILAQVSFGLLANNNSGIESNLSDGFAMILTGAATGVGNQATSTVEQDA